MKNTFIITNLTIGSVALFLVLDILFWHCFGLDDRKLLYWQLYRSWFWFGLLFTVLATPFAAWSVRGHWKSSRLLGQFIWCCSLVVGYIVLFIWCEKH
jgi:hypothetical protein